MYSYIKGIITDITSQSIVLENNGIGYLLYVSNPYSFKMNQEKLVYVYQQVKEDDILLYGFQTKEEKDFFLKLIQVKGIGCKSAIGILATGDVHSIQNAIEEGNVAYLKKIPGIGPKAAGQIILDLQGKVQPINVSAKSQSYLEAIEVLEALGYKKAACLKAMENIKEDLDTNEFVKKALAILVK